MMVFNQDGKIGIGTTAPGYQLHTTGTVRHEDSGLVLNLYDSQTYSAGSSGAVIRLQGKDSAGAEKNLVDLLGTSRGANQGEFAIKVRNSSGNMTQYLTIDDAGNVGIGTNTAESQVEIQGSSNSSYAAGTVGLTNTATLFIQNTDNTAAAYSQIVFGTRVSSVALSRIVSINVGANDSDLAFVTNNSEAMRIDGSSGNVGINTTSPSYILDISGSSAEHGSALNLNAAAASRDTKHLKITRSSSTGSIGIAGSQANDPLWITRSDGYDLMITKAGKVGIGTTTPNRTLSVSTNLAKTSTTTAYPFSISSNESSGMAQLSIHAVGGASAAVRYWNFQTEESGVANAGNIVFQQHGGNVGIGVASPDVKLHIQTSDASLSSADGNASLIVEENDHTYIELLTPNDKQSGIIFSDGSIAGLINYNHSTNAMNLQTAGATFLSADSSQNVTIGENLTVEETVNIGTYPLSASLSTHDFLKIGGNAVIASYGAQGPGGEVDFNHNVLLAPNGQYQYISTDEATMFRMGGGKFQFRAAAAGNAGAQISFTESAQIKADGTYSGSAASTGSFGRVNTKEIHNLEYVSADEYYYFEKTGKKAVSDGVTTELLKVGHSHNYTVKLWCVSNNANQGSWHGVVQTAYGSAAVNEEYQRSNGSMSDITVTYNNSGGSVNYILEVKVDGVDATVYYQIAGQASEKPYQL